MNKSIIAVLVILISITSFGLVSADVNGANVTAGTPQRGPSDVAQSAAAFAGNITELTVSGYSLTQSWQGYYGNVTGAIELTDGSSNVLYNWSLASPQGEVYASNSSAVTWATIQCFNMTSNASQLEAAYNISTDDADGINDTFSDGLSHDAFSSGTVSFTSGQCPSTRVFDSTGQGVDNSFEEVLLTDGSDNTVFAALLEQDVAGFNDLTHDFEMIVLEDGHSGDITSTTYFFYVELE